MSNKETEYKATIGLRNTKIVNGKEVFVDWQRKPEEELCAILCRC